jgi:hypothetical protein
MDIMSSGIIRPNHPFRHLFRGINQGDMSELATEKLFYYNNLHGL